MPKVAQQGSGDLCVPDSSSRAPSPAPLTPSPHRGKCRDETGGVGDFSLQGAAWATEEPVHLFLSSSCPDHQALPDITPPFSPQEHAAGTSLMCPPYLLPSRRDSIQEVNTTDLLLIIDDLMSPLDVNGPHNSMSLSSIGDKKKTQTSHLRLGHRCWYPHRDVGITQRNRLQVNS